MPALIKRISNLHFEGPTIEIIIFPPAPIMEDFQKKNEPIPQKKILALIDTGASNSCIDIKIAKELELVSRDFISVLTPSGISDHFTYDVAIMLPQQLQYKSFFIEVTGGDLERQPYDALIGRDILESCTLIYNGWDGSFQLHI